VEDAVAAGYQDAMALSRVFCLSLKPRQIRTSLVKILSYRVFSRLDSGLSVQSISLKLPRLVILGACPLQGGLVG
jgi:hypothetical protein